MYVLNFDKNKTPIQSNINLSEKPKYCIGEKIKTSGMFGFIFNILLF